MDQLQCHIEKYLLLFWCEVLYQGLCLGSACLSCIALHQEIQHKSPRHLATRVKEHIKGPLAIQSYIYDCSICEDNYSCDFYVIKGDIFIFFLTRSDIFFRLAFNI